MRLGPIIILCACASAFEDAAQIDTIRARLQDGKIAQIYSKTYTSLLGRVEPDGFFQESMTGAYPGMFPRTVGGLVSLFLETGELDACERLVGCVLEATRVNEMERVPHVFGRNKTGDPKAPAYPIISDRDEVDGQAHIIMAWGRLAARRGPTPFEGRTFGEVAKLLDRSTDWPYILTGGKHADLGLVRNVSLEHSREGRMWDTYDILTQSFVGAALDAIIPIAERRGDQKHVELWKGRLERLRAAVAAHLLRESDGKTVYLEMRLPNSDEGVPFEGMGWLNLSPVAAQWEPCEPQILRNTVEALRARDLKEWHGLKYLGTDWLPSTGASPQVIGKGVGWEIDYARREGEWGRILEWFDFIEAVNDTPLYMEAANYVAEKDTWQLQDSGNGEQCAWWCWSIARLRKQAGLSPQCSNVEFVHN